MDSAIASRTSLQIKYAPLDKRGRLKLWRIFAEKAKLTPEDLEEIAMSELRGRDVSLGSPVFVAH